MNKKVVVITGASSGIGKACAENYAKAGYRVMLAARNEKNLIDVAKVINESGGIAESYPTDVSQKEECEKLIEKTIQIFGQIDVLINSAGISMRALFLDADLSVIEKVMSVNFWGTVYCTKYALPYILNSKGSVVGVSSIAGYTGLPGRTGYSASKYAIQGFLYALRAENRKTGLHVMIACPGFTASNIRKTALTADGTAQGNTPREEGEMMPAEEVAKHIFIAVKNRKREIVLTRDGKLAVLLGKFFPRFVERKVYEKMAREPDSPFK